MTAGFYVDSLKTEHFFLTKGFFKLTWRNITCISVTSRCPEISITTLIPKTNTYAQSVIILAKIVRNLQQNWKQQNLFYVLISTNASQTCSIASCGQILTLSSLIIRSERFWTTTDQEMLMTDRRRETAWKYSQYGNWGSEKWFQKKLAAIEPWMSIWGADSKKASKNLKTFFWERVLNTEFGLPQICRISFCFYHFRKILSLLLVGIILVTFPKQTAIVERLVVPEKRSHLQNWIFYW